LQGVMATLRLRPGHMADVLHLFWLLRDIDPGRGGSLRHELVETHWGPEAGSTHLQAGVWVVG